MGLQSVWQAVYFYLVDLFIFFPLLGSVLSFSRIVLLPRTRGQALDYAAGVACWCPWSLLSASRMLLRPWPLSLQDARSWTTAASRGELAEASLGGFFPWAGSWDQSASSPRGTADSNKGWTFTYKMSTWDLALLGEKAIVGLRKKQSSLWLSL